MRDMMKLKRLNNLIWKDENEKNDKHISNCEHDDYEQSLERVCLYHEHDGSPDEYWHYLLPRWKSEISIMKISKNLSKINQISYQNE